MEGLDGDGQMDGQEDHAVMNFILGQAGMAIYMTRKNGKKEEGLVQMF